VRVEPLVGQSFRAGLVPALLHMRRRIAEEGIDVLAWISAAVLMPFTFAMRLAPRQVWWAMKYHALEFPEIDDYLTGGSQTGGTKTIHGRTWRVGPVAAADWFAPELADEARRTRDALGAKGVVYGSFGREEKLNSPAFLDAVCEILRNAPDATFLWTGRARHPAIQAHLEAAGVAGRCRFIGWVNTKLYAQVIDVFLDSFPFPCGFTLYEAMAAGKPIVLFDSPASRNTGIHALVGPLLGAAPQASDEARLAHAIFRPDPGTELYLRPAEPAGYVAAALHLARDAAFRQRAGDAARAFVEQLMSDRKRAARIFVDHILGRDGAAAPS
jgi:glycosyltransferase involved in cell wall biosynthesis